MNLHLRCTRVACEKRLIGSLIVIWIVLIGSLLFISWRQAKNSVIDLAVAEARASFNKDLLFRRWGTMHGGVYVPPTDKTPPNPYLSHIPDRDVITTGDKSLTLVNPAYMTRQIHELGQQEYGARGHITSLNPIRPENEADPWETLALEAFQAGRAEEIRSIEITDDLPFLRFMKPMVTEKNCLKCHAAQGYREGDIRGGLSISIPLTPYLNIAGAQKLRLLLIYGIIGLLGVAGIWVAGLLIIRSRKELRAERDRLQYVLEGTNVGTWEWNVQTGETIFNERWANIIGYTLEEISPVSIETWIKFCHPDDLKESEKRLQQCFDGRSAYYDIECRMRHKSGEWVWVHDRGKVATWTKDGRPEWMYGTHQEITARKRDEQALKDEHDLFATGPVCMITWSPQPQWPVTFVTENTAQVLGYTPEEMTAPDFRYAALIHPDDLERVALEVKRAFASGAERFEQRYRLRCKSGEYRWFSDFTLPIRDNNGKVTSILGYMFDDNERMIAEIERERLLSAIEQTRESIVITDSEGTIQYVNPAFEQITGYTRKEVIGRNPRFLKSGEHDEPFYKKMWDTLVHGDSWHGKLINKNYDGTLFTEEATISPVKDITGNIISYVAVKHDVTREMELQNSLKEHEELLRSLINATPDIICFKDGQGRWLEANDADLELFSLTKVDYHGKTDSQLADFTAPLYRQAFLTCEATDEQAWQAGGISRGEEVIPTIDGKTKYFDVIKVPLFQEDGSRKGLVVLGRDITERKRLEEQYRQAQKVESIGRLAGGVAHDLNNLLSPIIGYGELLQHDTAPEDGRRDMVDAILSAGFRARDLVSQLLAFSRKQTLEFNPVDINKVATEFEKFLRQTIPEDIEMELFLSSDPLMVMADIGQIEQVLMNLAVNAADAMPEGGRLTIETAPIELDEKYAAEHVAVEPGSYVLLAVSDTGCGMDKKTKENIFEPFFSTKGEAGTGMGLATVYGIIKQHGGNIWVYSEPGAGTTFKIYLPVCEIMHTGKATTTKELTDLNGSETILLAEDNGQVRDLARTILERQGYTVLTAENGKEALAISESHHGPLHLLLTDVVMPEMNGRDLFARASRHHPELKVVYMSGYTDNVIAHQGVLDENIAFIQKPFTLHALAAKVREVLEQ